MCACVHVSVCVCVCECVCVCVCVTHKIPPQNSPHSYQLHFPFNNSTVERKCTILGLFSLPRLLKFHTAMC